MAKPRRASSFASHDFIICTRCRRPGKAAIRARRQGLAATTGWLRSGADGPDTGRGSSAAHRGPRAELVTKSDVWLDGRATRLVRVRRSKSLRAGLAGVSPPALAAVSFGVSFAGIRERPLRPTGHGHPSSRTVPDWREHRGATLGKHVGGNPSGVRISYPPPPLTRQYTSPGHAFGLDCKAA